MEVYRHAFGGAAPAGAAGGGKKNALASACPRFCPGRPPAEDDGVQTPPGQRPRAAEFCFRGTTSLAALLQTATLPRPRPPPGPDALPGNGGKTALRYWGRTARSRRLLAGDLPLPARVRLFSARRLSVRGELGEECVLFKAVWFVASLRCWLYFSPAAPICQLFFVRFVTFLVENLCKLQNIVQFEFFHAQEIEAWSFGPRRGPLSHFRALPRLAAPGQNAADLLQFYVFSSFF